jgi:hypothetical protein
MTYDQADNILKGLLPDEFETPPPPPLTAGGRVDRSLIAAIRDALSKLTQLARLLCKKREDVGGAVDLSSGDLGNELKFTLVDGRPVKVLPKAEKEIHHTIAELMILANSAVADKIQREFPESALLRIHRTVSEDRFNDLREILDAHGLSFHGNSNRALAATLKQVSKMNSTADALLKSLATRAMSEAQYVCTADVVSIDDLSHYGLGLGKYTHFTSPIRRYADVVVHKQLLASLQHDQKQPSSKPSRVVKSRAAPIASLPRSNVVSILEGEGLAGNSGGKAEEDMLDSLIEGASELALGPLSISTGVPKRVEEERDEENTKPYSSSEVTRICEGLNLHNRLAKSSSYECQKLFLSLYFRDHTEVTQAVVVKLHTNGFWCYIPRFDIRVPVYVKDRNGRVQVDPGLLGLPRDAGMPYSKGFGGYCRLFPQGKSELLKHPNESLVVFVPEAKDRLVVRPLDVITVQLACESFDLRARVPSPRAHLIARETLSIASKAITAAYHDRVYLDSDVLRAKSGKPASGADSERVIPKCESLFQLITSLTKRTAIGTTGVSGRSREPIDAMPVNSNCTIAGRIVFGSFVNPDTRSARQELLQRNAASDAAQRRYQVQMIASRGNEYDSTNRLEREVTSRQQRLAAEKRNARRSKAK